MGVKFCDDCGSILADSAENIIICDMCGKNCKSDLSSHTMTSKSSNFPSSLRTRLTSNTQKLTAKDLENTRRIVRECTQCQAKELIWSEAQMRSADEGSTIFYRCPDCGHSGGQIQLPGEITNLILSDLPNSTLKEARLVCREYSEIGKPHLFQAVTVSIRLCHVRRLKWLYDHPEIARYVRCIIYQEMDLLTDLTWSCGFYFGPEPEMTFDDYVSKLELTMQAPDWRNNITDPAGRPWLRLADDWSQCIRRRSEKLFCSHTGCGFVTKVDIYLALGRTLRAFPRLRTLISRERKESCHYATAFTNEMLLSSYPALYVQRMDLELAQWLAFSPQHISSRMDENDGFRCLLHAMLCSPGNRVETFVTERASGLLKQGVPPLGNTFTLFPVHILNLRAVNLCLDVPRATPGQHGEEFFFPAFLERAPRLEHLHLSFTYGYFRRFSGVLMLPKRQVRVHGLKSLVLENAALTGRRLATFLVQQRQSLRHLVLWKCSLSGPVSWEKVIDDLAAARLTLKYFILKTPTDCSMRVKYRNGFLGSRLDNNSLLEFINSGGQGQNPFEQQVWRSVKPAADLPADNQADILGQPDPAHQQDESPQDQEMVNSMEDEDGAEYQAESDEVDLDYPSDDSNSDSGWSSDDNSLVDVEEERLQEMRDEMEPGRQSNRPSGSCDSRAFFREMWDEVDKLI